MSKDIMPLTREENEQFLRRMREIVVDGTDQSVGLDRVFLLLEQLDEARTALELCKQEASTGGNLIRILLIIQAVLPPVYQEV